jgi:hypothetical protein
LHGQHWEQVPRVESLIVEETIAEVRMRRSLVALLLALTALFVSCPEPVTPTTNDGVWDSSNWDSTAVWK